VRRETGCQTDSFSFHLETQQPKAKAKEAKAVLFLLVSVDVTAFVKVVNESPILLYNRKAKTTDDFHEKVPWATFCPPSGNENDHQGACIFTEKIHGQWFALHPGMKIPLFFP
jgi:hypothetical protein